MRATLLSDRMSENRNLFGLAPGGVYQSATSLPHIVSSYLTFAPLPVSGNRLTIGCVFSVTLSVGSPLLCVTERPALRCSDFPHEAVASRDRLDYFGPVI